MLLNLLIVCILIFVLAAIYFFLPFRIVNEQKSNNYYYNFLKTEVHYIPLGNSFELGDDKIKTADVRSVEVVGRDYLKDKSHVYYKYRVIKNADTHTIKMLSPNNHVFAVDQNMIYYEGHAFKDIDIKSLQFLGDSYGSLLRDKNHLYSTFAVDYIADNDYIIPPLEGIDPGKYQFLNDFYGKDDSTAYYKGKPLKGSDAKTFTLLEDYAKDTNSVYCNGLKIKGMDAATLCHIEGSGYFKDKNHVYYGLNGIENSVGNIILYSGKIVKGADPVTFSIIKGEKTDYAKDKTRYYWGGKTQ
ncbi:MAG TPA: DKNYY domain-containing protein [Hanamia sp.]